ADGRELLHVLRGGRLLPPRRPRRLAVLVRAGVARRPPRRPKLGRHRREKAEEAPTGLLVCLKAAVFPDAHRGRPHSPGRYVLCAGSRAVPGDGPRPQETRERPGRAAGRLRPVQFPRVPAEGVSLTPSPLYSGERAGGEGLAGARERAPHPNPLP